MWKKQQFFWWLKCAHEKYENLLKWGRWKSQFPSTGESLKVTRTILCRPGKVVGFISKAEWQIQYNASSRSEHFTVGPGMWPWFRWMSTSNLYSSNQQSLTETHAASQLDWLFLLPAVLILLLRRVKEKKKRQRYPQTQSGSTPTPGCSLHTSSQRFTDPRSSCVLLCSALSERPGVTGPQTPDLLQAPRAPVRWQCRPGAECSSKGLQRSRTEEVAKKNKKQQGAHGRQTEEIKGGKKKKKNATSLWSWILNHYLIKHQMFARYFTSQQLFLKLCIKLQTHWLDSKFSAWSDRDMSLFHASKIYILCETCAQQHTHTNSHTPSHAHLAVCCWSMLGIVLTFWLICTSELCAHRERQHNRAAALVSKYSQ